VLKIPHCGNTRTVSRQCKKTTQQTIYNLKKSKKMPTHKTAHLQTAQTDTQPMFAKELFSSQRTQAHPPPLKTR